MVRDFEQGRRDIKKRQSQHQEQPKLMFRDTDSQSKLRRLSEKGAPQRQGSFGAQDEECKKTTMLQNVSFDSSHDKKRILFTASDGSFDGHNSPKSFKLSMSDWSGGGFENLRMKSTNQP